MKKSIIWIVLAALAASTVLGIFLLNTKSEKTPGLLEKIDSYRGLSRVVSQEECDFYAYFVERDLGEEVSEEEFEKLVKEYAGRVNAVFYLGSRLDLCEPYSFESLKLRLEQENADRQAKKADGAVIYGLEQFTLKTYFQYTMDNVEASLRGYLEANADEEILKMAKDYYEAHKEEFLYREEVVYEQWIDGEKETVTADSDMLSYIGKAEPGLADFLGIAEVGDIYEDEKNDQDRIIVMKEISDSEDGYENHAQMALYRLVRFELYDSIIEAVAKNNPVEFE